jgi:sugar (pentulose or hexulose) kinase
MATPQLIGLDVGTTSCKGGLFTADGRLLALASAGYPLRRPYPGHVEQDAGCYWDGAAACIRDLLASPAADRKALVALGSCGQAPTLVLLDNDDSPIRPAIIWQDTRAAAEAERLAADPGPEELARLMDLRWPVDASMPLARLRWLRQHEPEVLRRLALILLPKDLVHLHLTGQRTTDVWSARGLVNQRTYDPIDGFRALTGLAPETLPRIHRPHDVIGTVSRDGAAMTGLPVGLPVVAGWSDAMAAMLGTGAMGRSGLACDVSGTSEVVGLTIDFRPADTGQLVAAPILDSGRWMLYGPTQASGASLGWALRVLTGGNLSAEQGMTEALHAPPGADGLIFLPYIDGERAPIWDARARGGFIGLASGHERHHLLRAVLEGVACSIRHILDLAEMTAGHGVAEVRIAGGGARLTAWNRIKADVCQRSLRPCSTSENGALGAAMLGALGVQLCGSVAEAGDEMVRLESPVPPDSALAAVYERTFSHYVALYPRLCELFHS